MVSFGVVLIRRNIDRRWRTSSLSFSLFLTIYYLSRLQTSWWCWECLPYETPGVWMWGPRNRVKIIVSAAPHQKSEGNKRERFIQRDPDAVFLEFCTSSSETDWRPSPTQTQDRPISACQSTVLIHSEFSTRTTQQVFIIAADKHCRRQWENRESINRRVCFRDRQSPLE